MFEIETGVADEDGALLHVIGNGIEKVFGAALREFFTPATGEFGGESGKLEGKDAGALDDLVKEEDHGFGEEAGFVGEVVIGDAGLIGEAMAFGSAEEKADDPVSEGRANEKEGAFLKGVEEVSLVVTLRLKKSADVFHVIFFPDGVVLVFRGSEDLVDEGGGEWVGNVGLFVGAEFGGAISGGEAGALALEGEREEWIEGGGDEEVEVTDGGEIEKGLGEL